MQHDPNLVLSPQEEPKPCFFCGRLTYLVDLDYAAHYCGQDDEAIAADLERLG